jgi:sucrose synthase
LREFSDINLSRKLLSLKERWRLYEKCLNRISETIQNLLDLISEPSDHLLENFISHVPMPLISKIAIISPHGWFGQTKEKVQSLETQMHPE